MDETFSAIFASALCLRVAQQPTSQTRRLTIGLMSDNERWEAWHRQQITAILNLVAATERQSGQHTEIEPLQFELMC